MSVKEDIARNDIFPSKAFSKAADNSRLLQYDQSLEIDKAVDSLRAAYEKFKEDGNGDLTELKAQYEAGVTALTDLDTNTEGHQAMLTGYNNMASVIMQGKVQMHNPEVIIRGQKLQAGINSRLEELKDLDDKIAQDQDNDIDTDLEEQWRNSNSALTFDEYFLEHYDKVIDELTIDTQIRAQIRAELSDLQQEAEEFTVTTGLNVDSTKVDAYLGSPNYETSNKGLEQNNDFTAKGFTI